MKGSRFCNKFLCLQFVPINRIRYIMTRRNTHIIIICGIKAFVISAIWTKSGRVARNIVCSAPSSGSPLSSITVCLYPSKISNPPSSIKMESQRYQNMFGTVILSGSLHFWPKPREHFWVSFGFQGIQGPRLLVPVMMVTSPAAIRCDRRSWHATKVPLYFIVKNHRRVPLRPRIILIS